MTIPNFDPWSEVLVAEIAGQKIRAPQYGLRGDRAAQNQHIIDFYSAQLHGGVSLSQAMIDFGAALRLADSCRKPNPILKAITT